MISRQENKLKAKLIKHLKEHLIGYVILPHQDGYTSGIPDLSISARGRTTWWELKHGTPDFESTGQQELTCVRLASASFCRYIIWQEQEGEKRTMIVHPLFIKHLQFEACVEGFDNAFLLDYIRSQHQ